MKQGTRLAIAVAILVLIVAGVLSIDQLRRAAVLAPAAAGEPTLEPGSIPIYLSGRLVGGFAASDMAQLQKASFVEPEEKVTQEGYLLRDVILLRVAEKDLGPDTVITVSSASRGKSAQVTWAEASEPANAVMFDVSNRGTLKLVSRLPRLDQREEWVQDTDKIEIGQ